MNTVISPDVSGLTIKLGTFLAVAVGVLIAVLKTH